MIAVLVAILLVLLLCVTVPLFAFIALVTIGCVVSQALLFVDWLAGVLEWCQIRLGERVREIEQKGFWK